MVDAVERFGLAKRLAVQADASYSAQDIPFLLEAAKTIQDLQNDLSKFEFFGATFDEMKLMYRRGEVLTRYIDDLPEPVKAGWIQHLKESKAL